MGYHIIEKTEQRDSCRCVLYRVACEVCGEESLKSKRVIRAVKVGCRSCSDEKKRTATIESVHRNTWSDFKHQCKARKKQNLLTYEQWLELSERPCFYCGEEYSNTKSLGHRRQILWHCNGIDRLDSDGPYSTENCVPCCQYCNSGKKEQTPEEYIERCRKVAQNYLE